MGVSSMKKSIVFLVMLFLVSNVRAQGNEVCLVYFTGYACGDDCGLTDTFMGGLMYEYLNLTAIKYNIDAGQGNMDVFDAYRETYGLPNNVPLVLFGENDYLLGKNDIYRNTEIKILSFLNQDGTNCPLESGYVPPSSLNPSDLPGQAEVFESEGLGEVWEEEESDDDVEIPEEETETFIPDIGGAIQSMIKDVVKSEHFYDWLIVTAAFIILIFGVSLLFVRKKVK